MEIQESRHFSPSTRRREPLGFQESLIRVCGDLRPTGLHFLSSATNIDCLSPQGDTIVARHVSAGRACKNIPESREAGRHNGASLTIAVERQMSLDTVQEIERAIGALSPRELEELYAWLDLHCPQPIDAQLQADLECGAHRPPHQSRGGRPPSRKNTTPLGPLHGAPRQR